MRIFGWLMLAFGVLYVASNLRDEIRGETDAYSPGLRASTNWIPDHYSKTHNPERFRGAMTYQWVYASGIVLIGVVTLRLCRRADQLDLLSPEFEPEDEG